MMFVLQMMIQMYLPNFVEDVQIREQTFLEYPSRSLPKEKLLYSAQYKHVLKSKIMAF